MIPHSKPLISEEAVNEASRVVRSGQLAQGPECEAFEAELAEYLGVPYVVVVSSGTAALHLGLLSLSMGPGNRVSFPSYVCTALLQATRQAGATPIVLDLPAAGLNINAGQMTESGDCVILPHMFGVSAPGVTDLDVTAIEDCAMAIGASAGGRKLGTIGILGVFSFYATKVLCTGEGGAICTQDGSLAEHIRDLRNYDGRSDDKQRFNCKMTDIQAAIGRVQLRSLDTFADIRRDIAARYAQVLENHAVTLPQFSDEDVPFRFVIRDAVREANEIVQAFNERGVTARRPVFEPVHRLMGHSDDAYPNTTRAFREAVSIPLYPALTEPEIQHIIETARDVL